MRYTFFWPVVFVFILSLGLWAILLLVPGHPGSVRCGLPLMVHSFNPNI